MIVVVPDWRSADQGMESRVCKPKTYNLEFGINLHTKHYKTSIQTHSIEQHSYRMIAEHLDVVNRLCSHLVDHKNFRCCMRSYTTSTAAHHKRLPISIPCDKLCSRYGHWELWLQVTSAAEVQDIKRVRTLMKSMVTSNPSNARGWIAYTRLEEVTGNLKTARTIIGQVCLLFLPSWFL
jgi:hypothetical protein